MNKIRTTLYRPLPTVRATETLSTVRKHSGKRQNRAMPSSGIGNLLDQPRYSTVKTVVLGYN